MSTATKVPQTSRWEPDDLDADDARHTLLRVGRMALARDSFIRFRYGDGFSSARAMGFQFVLSFIPLVIAVVGLSGTLHARRETEVLSGSPFGAQLEAVRAGVPAPSVPHPEADPDVAIARPGRGARAISSVT